MKYIKWDIDDFFSCTTNNKKINEKIKIINNELKIYFDSHIVSFSENSSFWKDEKIEIIKIIEPCSLLTPHYLNHLSLVDLINNLNQKKHEYESLYSYVFIEYSLAYDQNCFYGFTIESDTDFIHRKEIHSLINELKLLDEEKYLEKNNKKAQRQQQEYINYLKLKKKFDSSL